MRILVLTTLMFISSVSKSMDVTFTEVANQVGLTYFGQTFGQSWADFDRDGFADLYVSNHGNMPTIYKNNNGQNFINISANITADLTGDIHAGAWADFDNDGDRDLLFTEGASLSLLTPSPNRLLVNTGGFFVDEAGSRGLEQEVARARTPSWLDWNNDGLLDVVLANWPRNDGLDPTAIFTQAQGSFNFDNTSTGFSTQLMNNFATLVKTTTQTEPILMVNTIWGFPEAVYDTTQTPFINLAQQLAFPNITTNWDFAAADFNGDLDQEIFFARWFYTSEVVQVNDNRMQAALSGAVPGEKGAAFAAVGTVDFYFGPKWGFSLSQIKIGLTGSSPVSREFTLDSADPAVWGTPVHDPNEFAIYVYYDPIGELWHIDITEKPLIQVIAISQNTMTNVQATNFVNSTGSRVPVMLDESVNGYVDITSSSGLTGSLPCQTVAAADFDNDMDVDIYLGCRSLSITRDNLMYENNGSGIFTLVSGAAGATGSSIGRTDVVSVADYDNNGFMDIVISNGEGNKPIGEGPTELYKNLGNANHWLHINLEGVTVNRDGIGAWVVLDAGGFAQSRLQHNGNQKFGQNDQRLHFGLGSNTVVDQITVRWPGGQQQVLNNVAADQIITIVQEVDTDGDGIDNATDPDDDGDGIPDTWEITYYLDPLDPADAALDPDNDTLSNYQEYLNGSDPNVFDVVPVNIPLPIWSLLSLALLLIVLARR